MPSETIYGGGGLGDDRVDVRVSWGTNEEGVVQLASLITSEDEGLQRLVGIVNDWLTEAKMPLIDADKLRAALPYAPAFNGWHATLSDWAAVNRLIRVLKRARDKQFGEPA